jgi:hypothetical protein
MNLICCICKNKISKDSKIAKIILIKRIQHDETIARLEYENDQKELYIHFNCLQNGNIPIISCRANEENFAPNSRIIDGDSNSLARNNILNF